MIYNYLDDKNPKSRHAFIAAVTLAAELDDRTFDGIDGKKIDVALTINGREVPFDKFMQRLYQFYDEDVESVAAQLVREKSDEVVATLCDLSDRVRQIADDANREHYPNAKRP